MAYSKEELEAMGLSKEEIELLLGTQEEGGAGLPFPLLKINYDLEIGTRGNWSFNPIKNEDKSLESYEYDDTSVKVKYLKHVYQYSLYDSTLNKSVVTSNIFSSLNEAKASCDLKTGKNVKDMAKELSVDKIPLNKILVGLIEIDGEWKPFIQYLNKSGLYEFNEQTKSLKNKGGLGDILTLSSTKKKKGNVVWYVPSVDDCESYDYIKEFSKVSPLIKSFNTWVNGVNTQSSSTADTTSSSTETTDVSEEDELNF